MKKSTMIVPNKIQHVIGSARGSRSKDVDVTADAIKRALCDRKHYHEYVYFESSDDIEVVSIVDYTE